MATETQDGVPSFAESLTLPRKTRLVPAFGAFVVFELDPVATLEALEDPIATEDVRALHNGKYVGYISKIYDLPSSTRQYHWCSCYMLSQGLPQASQITHTEETMCIPIAPATHPRRSALTPSPPLPWDNLYLHSGSFFQLRIMTETREIDHSSSPMLTLGECLDVSQYTTADAMRRRELRNPSTQVASPDEDISEDQSGEDESSFHSSARSESTSQSHDSDSPEFPATLALWDDPRDNQFIPVASFNLDLTTVTEFSNARRLREEIAVIDRVRVESKERSRANLERLDRERVARDRLERISLYTSGVLSAPRPPSLTAGKTRKTWQQRMRALVPCLNDSQPFEEQRMEDALSIREKGSRLSASPMTRSQRTTTSGIRPKVSQLLSIVSLGYLHFPCAVTDAEAERPRSRAPSPYPDVKSERHHFPALPKLRRFDWKSYLKDPKTDGISST